MVYFSFERYIDSFQISENFYVFQSLAYDIVSGIHVINEINFAINEDVVKIIGKFNNYQSVTLES